MMSLLAEEIVEEWLNRQGYFTIRGIKVGVDEIDLLAIKPKERGGHDCRHVEVQVSINPISYVSKVPKELRKQQGIAPNNAKRRDDDQLRQGVNEWIARKFDHQGKADLREKLCPGAWSRELVVGRIKHENEIDLLKEAGITIHRLRHVLEEMSSGKSLMKGAAGSDLLDLTRIGTDRT
jgi:hypothetical protein